MPNIFICYRRKDADADAGRLRDHFERAEGFEGEVFLDVESIHPGADFVDKIHRALGYCDVMLVVIGDRWLEPVDGVRRIDDPEDHLRKEIEAALLANTAIIPVLVKDAKPPKASELPDGIRPLARLDAAKVDHETFARDADDLLATIRRRAKDARTKTVRYTLGPGRAADEGVRFPFPKVHVDGVRIAQVEIVDDRQRHPRFDRYRDDDGGGIELAAKGPIGKISVTLDVDIDLALDAAADLSRTNTHLELGSQQDEEETARKVIKLKRWITGLAAALGVVLLSGVAYAWGTPQSSGEGSAELADCGRALADSKKELRRVTAECKDPTSAKETIPKAEHDAEVESLNASLTAEKTKLENCTSSLEECQRRLRGRRPRDGECTRQLEACRTRNTKCAEDKESADKTAIAMRERAREFKTQLERCENRG